MKVNLKLGGINHYLAPSQLPGADKDTMIIGLDVTHPSPGSASDAPSIAASVASVDGRFSQYRPSIRAQASREEMVSSLRSMICEHLKYWHAKNGLRLPTKIILYRDGKNI